MIGDHRLPVTMTFCHHAAYVLLLALVHRLANKTSLFFLRENITIVYLYVTKEVFFCFVFKK